MRGLCLSLPGWAMSRELPPGPRNPEVSPSRRWQLTPLMVARNGQCLGSGGRLVWAFMQRAWAGPSPLLPSPELSSPLESNRKVPGKQTQGAARARVWNKRTPHRARPDTRARGELGDVDQAPWDRDPATLERAGWSSHRSDVPGS